MTIFEINIIFIFHLDPYCYKIISHPATSSVNSTLVISAHEDKKIRFFDINSGKLVYQIVAHQDACTNLAIDPTCFYLLSSSKHFKAKTYFHFHQVLLNGWPIDKIYIIKQCI
jgi:WD40 repeat protein